MLETIHVGDLTVVTASPVAPAAGGPRPPVLLVHGYMGGAWYFERYQRYLASRGWESWAVNLRGRAGSRAVARLGTVSMRDYVRDALDAAAALAERHGVRRPVVLGHSMGGLVAQKVAEAGMAAALVLLCSAPPRGISFLTTRILSAQLRYLWPTLRMQALTATLDDFAFFNFNRTPTEAWDTLFASVVPDSAVVGRELTFSLVPVDAARVDCPVLVASATEDRFFPPRVGRRVAAKYGATFLELPGHAHFVVAEPGWEGPAAQIERWMTAAVGAAPRPGAPSLATGEHSTPSASV